MRVYWKDTSVSPNNLISILVTISILASWFVGELVCQRVGCRRIGLSASWFVGELSSYRHYYVRPGVKLNTTLVTNTDPNPYSNLTLTDTGGRS